jgi:hypothetical protein
MGNEKDAGALQDLLRRVMEIDAEITNTPVQVFKPNVSHDISHRSTHALINKTDTTLCSLLYSR